MSGVPQRQAVPLSDYIRQQFQKDVWLLNNDPGYDPRWVFLWATRLIAETRAYGIERGAMQIPRIADVFSSIPGRVVVWDGIYTCIVIRTEGLLPGEQQ